MMKSIFLEAPAKINLYLAVLGRIAAGPYGGYHDLDMLMQSISLQDVLTLEKRQGESVLTVSYPHHRGTIPQDEGNLAMRAWRLMQERYQLPEGIAIHIEKHIPVGAGLAGGSSDAAAVLKGVNRLFDLGLSLAQLAEIGAVLGGDVPFCVYQGLARAEGIGERLTPLMPLPQRNCVLVNPGITVLTSEIFHAYDIMEQRGASLAPASDKAGNNIHYSKSIDEILPCLDWACIDGLLRNDLEAAAVERYPVIAEIKEDLRSIGLVPFMSGSGPSVIAFWQGAEAQRSIERYIVPKWAITVFCRTL